MFLNLIQVKAVIWPLFQLLPIIVFTQDSTSFTAHILYFTEVHMGAWGKYLV